MREICIELHYEALPIVITDEMCDNALKILHPGPGNAAESERNWIRPALEAALNPEKTDA